MLKTMTFIMLHKHLLLITCLLACMETLKWEAQSLVSIAAHDTKKGLSNMYLMQKQINNLLGQHILHMWCKWFFFEWYSDAQNEENWEHGDKHTQFHNSIIVNPWGPIKLNSNHCNDNSETAFKMSAPTHTGNIYSINILIPCKIKLP